MPFASSSANKCLLKVAGYAAQLEQYQKAIEIFEQVGTLPFGLLRENCKSEYKLIKALTFFKRGSCIKD